MAIRHGGNDNSYVLTESLVKVVLKDTTEITEPDEEKLEIDDNVNTKIRTITYDGDPVDYYDVDVSYSLHDNLGVVTNRVRRYDGEWK